ncbi:MAG: site-specific integrase [Rickettsiales bacterium]|nr:site-specific integrase [Rickettsiales bacterium]
MATIETRKTDSGETSFRVKVRLKGSPPQTASFTRKTDAQRWAQQTEAAIREGRYFKTSQARKHTLADLIERYKRDVLPAKSRSKGFAEQQGAQLDWWKAQLGAYTLCDVTPSLIAEKRDELGRMMITETKRRSPASVNRYLAALSHAFTIAVKEWGWLEDNPVRKVSRPREAGGRVRFLSDAERVALLKICRENTRSPYLYTVVVVALSTGARLGEILGLKWADVDFRRGVITLHETKNGERRVLPLTGHALETMRIHENSRRTDTELVFPNRAGNKPASIRKAFDNALVEAEIEDFHFHDLRHSAASYLAMNGASLAEIAEVLGHKTLQMVKRYAHLSEAHTSQVVARMNERIFG